MAWLTYPHRKVNQDTTECPNCHANNSRYRANCWRCGSEL